MTVQQQYSWALGAVELRRIMRGKLASYKRTP